jgi:cytochrome c553
VKWRRRWLLRLVALIAAFGLGGIIVAASGVLPIGASGGHWSATEKFLQFAKRRSISTHTIGLDLPPLDEPWMIMKGAGHYETGCRPCHGAPDSARPRIASAMLPSPPDLDQVARERDPEALFYAVKHGVKLTGMPAWPAPGRDDEVQAVTAFLIALPSLDARSYRRLVHDDVSASLASLGQLESRLPARRWVVEACTRCHGDDGRGRGNAAFPSLAGQKREYLERALLAYARERRHSGIMGPIATALTSDQQRELADYYSGLTAKMIEPVSSDPRIVRGRAIAVEGIASQEVPPCNGCHDARGIKRNEAYPLLAGQYAGYLVLQLELFAKGERGGSEYAHLMERTAKRLTPAQMRDVAAFYSAFAEED